MPVVQCPKCPTQLKTPDGARGNTKCPKCATVFAVGGFAYYAWSTGRWTLLDLFPPILKDARIPLAALGIGGVLIFVVFQWLWSRSRTVTLVTT